MKAELNYLFNLLTLVTPKLHSTGAPGRSAGQQSMSSRGTTPGGNESTWPRGFVGSGVRMDFYQPEIEKWKGTDFETMSAIAISGEEGDNQFFQGLHAQHTGV